MRNPQAYETARMAWHWALRSRVFIVATQIRRIIPEDQWTETLREGGITAAENESSVVLYWADRWPEHLSDGRCGPEGS